MIPIDYGRSFVIGTAAFNECRFWIESRLRIVDERENREEVYLQGASCKSEHTFVETDLFNSENYDFLPIFGPERGIFFRRKAYLNDNYKTCLPDSDMFGGVSKHLVEVADARQLLSNEEVREATYRFSPIVAQVEIADADNELRAVLEFPVKTMNTRREGDWYQVDTGPLLLPDLSRRYDHHVESIALAFVAFNTSDFADFVLEKPTPIGDDQEGTGSRVHHFSELKSFPSQNRLYAL